MSDALHFGTSMRDITPPAGSLMGAFPVSRDPMQARVAEGAHDPIMARAFALRQKDMTVVVVVADVVSFQWPDVDVMRAAFAGRTGLPPESLIVCGTHNHNGPECTYLFGGRPDDPYIGHMRGRVVDAACEAIDALAPADLLVGSVDADLSYNRRRILPNGQFQQLSKNPDRLRNGPIDPKVTVLRLDRSDDRTALLHFAAHPVIMTAPNRLFTAEYPGETLRRFEAQTKIADAIFLQGACGDTHPYQAITEDFAAVGEMGEGLAKAASSAWQQARAEHELSLSVERWTGNLPHRYSSEHKVRIEATTVRLSPRLALVFWQGEPFIELSLTLQWRSPLARTIVVGYSLGWIGYVPTRQAYEYGGYGVSLHEGDPAEFSRTSVRPGTGEQIVDRTAELLLKLHDGAHTK
ncbi:MAG: neutral/alkaline non-lysosomal ceramidase N-terminal domain-containing protein [Planctomycetota bacterium]